MSSNTDKLSLLKAQLATELSKADSDNDIILSLSTRIAELDDSKIRFSVDAAIINRLGKELVGKVETAVAELVKNAYDADAVKVKLTFENCDIIGGTLIIQDYGTGMTRNELIKGFMRISSADKIENPFSKKYNRKKAGQKGIGRFATQRLGEQLTILTKTKESKEILKVQINWKDFESNKDVQFITNSITTFVKTEGREEGTTLFIYKLREAWSDAMIKRVYRYVSDILQPFPLSKIQEEQLERQKQLDPGFDVEFRRKVENGYTIIANVQNSFYEFAVAEIDGWVDNEGVGKWSLKSNRFIEFNQTQTFPIEQNGKINKFSKLKNIHFKAYYFIADKKYVPTLQLANIREVLNEKGGIRVYNNGFRVLPFGDPQNDWLGLDESTRRRTILPVHGNNNFLGFVEIFDSDSFNELSNREGFILDLAYEELVDFIYRAIIASVLKIAALRGIKGTTNQKNWETKERKKTIKETISDVRKDADYLKTAMGENLNNKDETDRSFSANYTNEILDRIQEGLDVIEEEVDIAEENAKKLLDENSMLRILASLGLMIGEFAHEIKHYIRPFKIDTESLIGLSQQYPEIINKVERLNKNASAFSTYTGYFDRAISNNALRELKPISIRVSIKEFISIIQPDLIRQNIKIHEPIFKGYGFTTIPMHESEIISILFNFYSNSKKAIIKTGRQGEILIEVGRNGKNIYLEFSDNGIGIPIEHDDNVFEAFFTTSSVIGHNATYQEELTGTGLGLKIVRDIIESYNGEIYVKRPTTSNFSTTIRIELPEIQENE